MADAELLKVLGGGGLAAALLALIYLVGMRLVAAVTALKDAFTVHTTDEARHHTEVKVEIAEMRSKIDTVIGWGGETPAETPRPHANPRARSEITPIGTTYAQHRKKPGEQ